VLVMAQRNQSSATASQVRLFISNPSSPNNGERDGFRCVSRNVATEKAPSVSQWADASPRKPRVQIAMAKLSALIEDVELDLSEAFTSIAREIVTEAEYLADEIETRLAQGHFSETIH